MIVFLIRHGQSYGNVIGNKKSIIKGSKDNTSLTNLGKKQIKYIAKNFLKAKIKVDKIFSSPLKRAYQSAKIFSDNFGNQKIYIDENIKEINFGDLERKSFDVIKNKYYHWWLKYQLDKFNTPFPNGESKKDLVNRVKIFIKENLKTDKIYVIFTHEEVIRAFLSVFYGDNQYFFSRDNLKTIKNAKINSVFYDGKNYLIYQINSVNPFILKINQFQLINKFSLNNNLKINYCQKNESYSDNLVFTIFLNKKERKILKLIPLYKEKNLQKEVYLCKIFKQLKLFPSPDCFNIEKYQDFFVHCRDYFDENLGAFYLEDNKTKKIFAEFMGKTLNNIHKKTLFLKNDLQFKKLTNFYDNKNWLEKFIYPWINQDLNTLKTINLNQEIIKKVKNIFNKAKKIVDNIEEGFIYYDFHPQNFTVDFLNNEFKLTGLWDFENVFWGDTFFDIAYTIKLSFLRQKILINRFLNGYFARKLNKKEKEKINFYLLMIITGSITYKNKREGNWSEEVDNLKFFLNL